MHQVNTKFFTFFFFKGHFDHFFYLILAHFVNNIPTIVTKSEDFTIFFNNIRTVDLSQKDSIARVNVNFVFSKVITNYRSKRTVKFFLFQLILCKHCTSSLNLAQST